MADADAAMVTSLEPATDLRVIDNPISGERIVIRQCAGETGGALLVWELFLGPGGRVRGRAVILTAGQTLAVPAGTVHSFANAGPGPVRVVVETRPALEMQALLETAAAMARDQHAAGRILPRPADLALFMRDFEREVRAPYLPAALVRPVMRGVARLASARGWDERYRRMREAG
jgi:hypothetical protein